MDNIYAQHKPEVGGGLWLKLADGETVRLRIMGEPAIFNSEYQGKLSTRYAWVVWNVDAKAPQIWQGSATFFKSLAAYATDEDYGDPSKYDIKIRREGTGTNTTYSITPGRNSYEISDEAKKACEQVDLIGQLSKNQSNSSVFWLKDAVAGTGTKPTQYDGIENTKSTFGDVQIIDDDAPDLSTIPF